MFDAQEERERASLAFCLADWKRPDGGKIPATEEGIAEHQALVEDYEDLYGKISEAGKRQYESVYANIRQGLFDAAENAEMERQFRGRREREKEEREAASEARREEMRLRRARSEATRILESAPQRIEIRKTEIERLTEYLARDEKRAAELTAKLDQPKWQAHRMRRSMEQLRDKAEERCVGFRSRMAEVTAKLAADEAELAAAQLVLEGKAEPLAGDLEVPTEEQPASGNGSLEGRLLEYHMLFPPVNKHGFCTKGEGAARVSVKMLLGKTEVRIFLDPEDRRVVVNGVAVGPFEIRETHMRSPYWAAKVSEARAETITKHHVRN